MFLEKFLNLMINVESTYVYRIIRGIVNVPELCLKTCSTSDIII